MKETKELNIPLGPVLEKWETLVESSGASGERMVLQMGPQHPATHGVLRLELETDGEIVTKIVPYIGYLHRCFEKVAENITWNQVVPYTDRMDYLASMNMSLGYALTVEKLMGIEVNERVQALRVITCEINRIASHCVFLATYGLDIGAWTPLLYLFQEREHIIDLLEELSGSRLLFNYIRPGGLAHDVPDGWLKKVREFCDFMDPKIPELNELLSYNKIFIERTANVGVMTPEVALTYGITGPNLRACGVDYDLRRDIPYSGYEKYDFEPQLGKGEQGQAGDSWDRYIVRVREMQESLKIIRQAIDSLPDGDISEKIPKNFNKMPVGDAYMTTEAPRGEVGFYIVSDGTKTPYRVKARSGAYCSVSVIPAIGTGLLIADVVAIVASVDIVLGEVDR
ncbi:NADH dehydrogenase subunit D [candidate division LCP-89 bacterium B3_LCP]|uniref:NADH-quinone oxidoreductase subunit D n=1 Tax=candidate division LCP-89 bacterium B3_LCP TaxID=2012998 RepID=A0A532V5T6_UNCL8|nr:MAG: NADH dehydrogenase subunit D [candidate division LCP-89 bacterium B3_LCP]